MIDFLNEIFTTVANRVRDQHTGTTVTGEYTRTPSKFPTVTLDETQNVTVDHLEDSGNAENFAGVAYRLQVFSNKQTGKKAEARAIFATADAEMRRMGFRRVTYTTTPENYESTIYCITATYEAVVNTAGYVYKR
ncbi:hypothetical protein [Succinimonas sp.]|uniref:hypothetical protein n=1 Tax=Succinimonas sp. TaxID=1936151 RepID=UPI0038697C3A